MPCFLLKGPLGERWMSDGENYQLLKGEAIVPGQIRFDCGDIQTTNNDIISKLEAEGIQWGDAIAWVTHKMQVKQCAPCKASQELFNESLVLGFKDLARRIKESL